MRYAVAKRPVEQFQTEVKLPEWQLEPDEEHISADPGDYYYIDEQGNLVEPNRPVQPGEPPFPVDGETAAPPPGTPGTSKREVPPPAASADVLDRATGKGAGPTAGPTPVARPTPPPPGTRPRPAPTPGLVTLRPTATPTAAPRQ
jgi:penicillin-binding protein 1A